GRPSAGALMVADGVWGHRKRGGRAAREHWTGPRKGGRPSARALEPADGVWGHRKRGGREAPEHWTGPRKGGRPSARALEPADGVWGHRKRGGREAPEHWTGPRNRWTPSASPLRFERVDRLHDTLDLGQVGAELRAQRRGRKARVAGAGGEELPDGGQRPHDALARGDDGGVAVPAVR